MEVQDDCVRNGTNINDIDDDDNNNNNNNNNNKLTPWLK